MKTMKKIVAIVAVALMLVSILPLSVFAADAETIKYTISSYPAGTQYKAETHELDEYLTVITNTRCHFTSELRIYAPNGGVNGEVILASTREMTAVVLNAGNKASTLTVSTSPDNSTWTQHSTLSVASSYQDLSISNLPAGTKYVKLVNGSGQVRVKYITVSYAADAPAEPEVPACEHENAEYDFDCVTGYCPDCEETLPALADHSYEEEITLNPTCTEVGEKTLTCACGDEKTEAVPALGHNYVDGFCSACGAEKPAGYAPITSADQLVSGQYVLVVDTGYAPTYINDITASSPWLLCGQPEIVDGIIADPTGFLFTLTVDGTTVKIQDANGNYIAPKAKDTNGIKVAEYAWDWTFEDGKFIFAGTAEAVYLASNTVANQGDNKFRGYKQATCTGTSSSSYKYKFTLYAAAKPACKHEFDNNCDNECNLCGEANPNYADHVYAHEFDVDCDVCGAIREVAGPISYNGKSVSEECNGYAVLFDVLADGIVVKEGTLNEADFTNATYNGYKLIGLSVVASNYKSTTTIDGVRMYDWEENCAKFAFRVINIPADKLDTEITMTPYYVVEIDGVATTIEGEAVVGSYTAVAG